MAVVAIIALTAGSIRLAMHEMGPPPIEAADALSPTVVDRHDRLLRAFTTPQGRWRLPVEVAGVDSRYIAMLVAYEDRRFHSHHGVDPLAFARGLGLAARHRRIVSGGSTLTMQVARLLQGEHERTGIGKLRQSIRALQLEQRLSKAEILRLYLRMAPFGGNIEGCAGGVAHLLRQGAAAFVDRRGSVAGRDPAVSGNAKAGPLAGGSRQGTGASVGARAIERRHHAG